MSGKDHYTVIGHPVSHSLSPQIHALFAEQTGQKLQYDTTDIKPENLAKEFAAFFASGGRGMNVTVPHKAAVHDLVDELTARAKLAGAVNTVTTDSGLLIGDNTDGEGLVRDLANNLKVKLGRSRILILGAGGATQGIVPALLERNPQVIAIANRTPEKATAIAERFSSQGTIEGCGYDAIDSEPWDLVIHGTSAGLGGGLPEFNTVVIGADTVCYDLSYAKEDTPFVALAKSLGCANCHDGLGMLVEQAAAAFELWRGVRPLTQPVIEAIRPV